MNLTRIRLKNFKRFSDVELSFGKVNLLTGANSSGKSSVIYGILGALQTHEFPFFFSPNGDYINMGDFEEIAFDHDGSAKFSIELDIISDDENPIFVKAIYFNNAGLPKLEKLEWNNNGFSLAVSFQSKNSSYKAAYSFDEKHEAFTNVSNARIVEGISKLFLEVTESKQEEKKGKASQEKKGKASQSSYDLPKLLAFEKSDKFVFKNWDELRTKASKIFYLYREVSKITETFGELKKKFNYISAFRLPPERTYYQKAKASLKIDKFGDNVIDQIYAWAEKDPSKINDLNNALSILGIASKIRLNPHTGGRFDVRVQCLESGTECSLPDVGFGVSQFLPIVVSDLQLGKKSILAISQPEIHLHPSAQAAYANWLLNRTDGDGNQYILETHSEYILNRLRLLIAEDKISSADVNVYYLSKDSSASIHTIKLHKNGSIEGAPEEFFDTYLLDTMELASAVSLISSR